MGEKNDLTYRHRPVSIFVLCNSYFETILYTVKESEAELGCSLAEAIEGQVCQAKVERLIAKRISEGSAIAEVVLRCCRYSLI